MAGILSIRWEGKKFCNKNILIHPPPFWGIFRDALKCNFIKIRESNPEKNYPARPFRFAFMATNSKSFTSTPSR